MSIVYFLNTLGGQPLINRYTSTFLFKTYDLILDIFLIFTTQNILIITMCMACTHDLLSYEYNTANLLQQYN
jgi:hypothetical protein